VSREVDHGHIGALLRIAARLQQRAAHVVAGAIMQRLDGELKPLEGRGDIHALEFLRQLLNSNSFAFAWGPQYACLRRDLPPSAQMAEEAAFPHFGCRISERSMSRI